LPENVRYLGSVSKAEVRDLLGTSEALIFPSESEGLPNTVLEAMSMGVPVLAQNKSSLPELINENHGWLLADDKINRWLEVLDYVDNLMDDKLRNFINNSREKTVENYSWGKYAREHESLYSDLLFSLI
jgi:glycosyltransferase involved in cell wall biosynthesis